MKEDRKKETVEKREKEMRDRQTEVRAQGGQGVTDVTAGESGPAPQETLGAAAGGAETSVDPAAPEKLENNPENKMGVMPVKKLLWSMAWPAILSMSINALYNVVDSMFVSRLNEDAFTALSIVNPVQMMIIAVAVGSGVGVNSLISRRLGAKNQQAADQAAGTSIRIGVFNYLIFLAIGLLATVPFVRFYADPGTQIYDYAITYMRIICCGSLFIHVQCILEKVLQATGNMVAPMICSLTGAITNIILDPILIFGLLGAPAMGVAGAALATIIGQFLGMSIGLLIMLRGNHLVKIQLRGFHYDWKVVADIYKVGLPSIVMQSIGSVMFVFYNRILSDYSMTAVAVLGAYFRIQSFVFMPVFGLNQGAMPIIGYNYGARNRQRLMDTYKQALRIAFLVMGTGLLIFQLFPKYLLYIFNASEEMLSIGVPALRIISLCFLPAAFGIITGTLFQGTGHGMMSLYASVLRQLVGILPLAYILIRIGGVTLSWAAFPLAELLGLAYSALGLRWLYKREIKNL